jgi:hypothetical protein
VSDLRAANIAVATRFYEALAAGDFDALAALHSDDIIFNLVGTTPVSGRWEGKDVCFGPVVADGVIGKLVAETIRFSREWRAGEERPRLFADLLPDHDHQGRADRRAARVLRHRAGGIGIERQPHAQRAERARPTLRVLILR